MNGWEVRKGMEGDKRMEMEWNGMALEDVER